MGQRNRQGLHDQRLGHGRGAAEKRRLHRKELSGGGRAVFAGTYRVRVPSIPMTMEDWAKRLDILLMADDREILTNTGTITAEIAKAHADSEFARYRIIQDRLYESDYDRFLAMGEGLATSEDGEV